MLVVIWFNDRRIVRLLLAGGVFRLSPKQRSERQSAPEVLLAEGLRRCGVDVTESPLEDLRRPLLDKSFDLVHVHHLSKAALAASLSPLSRPMIFTEHGMPNSTSKHLQIARRVIYSKSSGVVFLSNNESTLKLEEFDLDSNRTWVIPNPVVLAGASPVLRTLQDHQFRMLYVGQLIRLKQVDRIIRSLAVLPTAVTLEVIFHNDELLVELTALAERLGVLERIEFSGQLSGMQLVQAYENADVLLLPSQHEALPSVISEALLTGLPIIASDVGGIPEQVGDAGLLVPPDREAPLHGYIEILMRDYRRFAAAAFDSVPRRLMVLSPEHVALEHLEMYETLLSTRT